MMMPIADGQSTKDRTEDLCDTLETFRWFIVQTRTFIEM